MAKAINDINNELISYTNNTRARIYLTDINTMILFEELKNEYGVDVYGIKNINIKISRYKGEIDFYGIHSYLLAAHRKKHSLPENRTPVHIYTNNEWLYHSICNSLKSEGIFKHNFYLIKT